MILNPDVAVVLDKAAEYVSEVDVMPTRFSAHGKAQGDDGFDALSAILFALIDNDYMTDIEANSGQPHLAEIGQIVADFGAVPECDRDRQTERFEVTGWKGELSRRLRRADDILLWARGRATSEVANLYRWAADEFRSRPANEGVYDTEGTHEHPEARGTGTFLTGLRALHEAHVADNPMFVMLVSTGLYELLNHLFVNNPHPDPDAAVVVGREDVPAARIAEIAQGVIDLINELDWTDTYLFNPETGAVSTRGAAALVVDLAPRMDYLTSKLHVTERRFAELWAFDTALADFLGLTASDEPCRGCGNVHEDSRNRTAVWENDGRDKAQVISALTGLRDAYVEIAAHDSVEINDLDWSSVEALFGQPSGGED